MNLIKQPLKNIHWGLLILMIILYTLLNVYSSEEDNIRKTINTLFISITTIWAGIISILTIKSGDKNKVIESITNAYHRFLDQISTLIIINFILVGIITYFLYLLIFFRQVEFVSDSKLELFLNDEIGKIEKVGIIEPKNISEYRIKVGERHFYYKEINGPQKGALLPIQINFFWQDQKKQRLTLELENNYEELN